MAERHSCAPACKGIRERVMSSAFDYRELARECVAEAHSCRDPDRKKALLDIAKLYNETALAMEAADAAPIVETEDRHADQ